MNIRIPSMLLAWPVLSVLVFTGGCEVPDLETPSDGATGDTAADDAAVPAEVPQAAPEAPAPREVTGRDPQQGRLSREAGGYLGTALGAGMYARHQAVFLQVKQTINHHYGLYGEYPQSHEEFMQQVIRSNNIRLPELEEGDEYLYDPTDHTLKIHRAAN